MDLWKRHPARKVAAFMAGKVKNPERNARIITKLDIRVKEIIAASEQGCLLCAWLVEKLPAHHKRDFEEQLGIMFKRSIGPLKDITEVAFMFGRWGNVLVEVVAEFGKHNWISIALPS